MAIKTCLPLKVWTKECSQHDNNDNNTVLSETRQMSLSTSSLLRQSRSHIILTLRLLFRNHLGSDQIARVLLTTLLSNYNWGSDEIHNIVDNSVYRSDIGV